MLIPPAPTFQPFSSKLYVLLLVAAHARMLAFPKCPQINKPLLSSYVLTTLDLLLP